MWFSALKQLVTWKRWVIRRKLLETTNTNSYISFRLVPHSMTLNDIWRSFQSKLSFLHPVCQKLYKIHPQLMKLFVRNHMRAFKWLVHCWWPWQYFKVIRLFHIKFLINGALYGKSYYRVLIGNCTLAFDWCHFWWPWRTFEGHFSMVVISTSNIPETIQDTSTVNETIYKKSHEIVNSPSPIGLHSTHKSDSPTEVW